MQCQGLDESSHSLQTLGSTPRQFIRPRISHCLFTQAPQSLPVTTDLLGLYHIGVSFSIPWERHQEKAASARAILFPSALLRAGRELPVCMHSAVHVLKSYSANELLCMLCDKHSVVAGQRVEDGLPPVIVERRQPTLLALSLICSKNLYSCT